MERLLTAVGEALAGSALLGLSAALIWGALSVLLSPCHLTSVPLVVAYMEGSGEEAKGRRAAVLSSAFALGTLASIAAVGLATAAAGRMLGDVGAVGNYLLAAMFVAVGLNLLGILRLPAMAVPSTIRSRGASRAMLLGGLFGVALGPCTFAFMAPILGIALRSGAHHAGYAAALITAYGIGHASALVAAGVSAQAAQLWVRSRAGERASSGLRFLAGSAVLAGGAYFLFSAR